MIRAWIGRFALHCIEQQRRRRMQRIRCVEIDRGSLTPAEMSDLLHGRSIRWSGEMILSSSEPGSFVQPRTMR